MWSMRGKIGGSNKGYEKEGDEARYVVDSKQGRNEQEVG